MAPVAERFGAPDALVLAAGIPGPTAPLWEIAPEDWDATLRANLTGVYPTCRAFLPGMVARGCGSVVVIGSMTGKRPLPGRTPYAAAKTALIGLVRTLAWDAGSHGVRVNLVSPGPGRRRAARPRARRAGPGRRGGVPRRLAARPLRHAGRRRRRGALPVLRRRSITGEDLNVSGGTVMHG